MYMSHARYPALSACHNCLVISLLHEWGEFVCRAVFSSVPLALPLDHFPHLLPMLNLEKKHRDGTILVFLDTVIE